MTLEPDQVRVSADELGEAHQQADPAYLATIARVRGNILAYQEAIRHHDVMLRRGTASSWASCIGRFAGWAFASRAGRRRIRRAC